VQALGEVGEAKIEPVSKRFSAFSFLSCCKHVLTFRVDKNEKSLLVGTIVEVIKLSN